MCITSCFFLAAFKILSLSVTFIILVIVCLGVCLFGFIVFGTLWAVGESHGTVIVNRADLQTRRSGGAPQATVTKIMTSDECISPSGGTSELW